MGPGDSCLCADGAGRPCPPVWLSLVLHDRRCRSEHRRAEARGAGGCSRPSGVEGAGCAARCLTRLPFVLHHTGAQLCGPQELQPGLVLTFTRGEPLNSLSSTWGAKETHLPAWKRPVFKSQTSTPSQALGTHTFKSAFQRLIAEGSCRYESDSVLPAV